MFGKSKKSEYERLIEEEKKIKGELGYLGEMQRQRKKVIALRQAKQRLSGGSSLGTRFSQFQSGVGKVQSTARKLQKYQPNFEGIFGEPKKRKR